MNPILRLRTLTFGLCLVAATAHAQESVPLNVQGGSKTGFTRLHAEELGIQFGKATMAGGDSVPVHVSNPGLSAGDVDGDGLCDLFVCRLNGSHALFRNLGDWKFENITLQSGLDIAGRPFLGSVFADIDADQDLDLFLLSSVAGSELFRNDGHGRFTRDTSLPWLRSDQGGEISAAFSDIDGDGDIDFYVTRYRQELRRYTMSNEDYLKMTNDAQAALAAGQKPSDEFLESFFVLPNYDGNEFTFNIQEKALSDVLYLNDGKGGFQRADDLPDRFRDEAGKPMGLPPDWGLAAAFRDIDLDGDPDLYVCNDFLSEDRFWINDGTGHFRLIDRMAQRRASWFSMGVDFADINRDGHMDYFVVDMLSRSHTRRKRQMGEMGGPPLILGRVDGRPQYMQNTLFLNRGDNTYSEIAQLAGIKASEWSWRPVFLDIDLDGYEDLIVSTGMGHDYNDADALAKKKTLTNLSPEEQEEVMHTLYPTLDTPNQIFRNRGDLTFENKSSEWGFTLGTVSGGMATADFDNDGDQDVVINNLENYPLEIYRNDSPAPRVAIRLRGSGQNRQAVGAKLRLSGGPVTQTQEVGVGGGYSSGSDPLRTFAAFNTNQTMNLEVTWRDGRRTVIDDLKANHLYVVSDTEASPSGRAKDPRPATLFEDQSAKLAHRHPETAFDDFALQPLLPNRLSQFGPGIAWFDVDRDGFDDLIVGSGAGGSIHVLINDRQGGFKDNKSPQLHMETTALAGFINHEGDATLFVGMANYESGKAKHPSAQGFYFKDGKRWHLQDGISHSESSSGPIAMGDIDGDGDLDLFVGGRVIPGKYPAPASSRTFLYDRGKWLPDTRNAKTLTNLGLVSGATFGDIDGDGDSDLIAALEWGAPKVFINNSGTLTDATAEWGLASYKGWWNGVALGDFDNDGRLDIVASNWGRNSKYEHSYSLLKPLQIYHGDLDDNGVWDVVEAHFDKYMKTLVPERGRSCSTRAMPFVGQRNTTYAEFGSRSLQEVYGSCLQDAGMVEANTLAHMIFLNRGKRFEGRQLPVEAQLAPGFHVGVADFNGDGSEDVFMSQNFLAVQAETPRNDGGRSLWLQGDGTGGFEAVPGHRSGIQVYGEGRGAALADYDRDGRVDLVVTQNGSQTKLYRNRSGKPGLRVRLKGTRSNPLGIGSILRLKFGNNFGPARQVASSSGYWSQNSSTQVLATPAIPTEIQIRWPGGKTTVSKVPDGARGILIDQAGAISKIDL